MVSKTKWQVDPKSGDQFVAVPDVCGAAWWESLENVTNALENQEERSLAQTAIVEAINCPSCRAHGIKLLSAMHDLQNWENGKPFFDETNFEKVANEYYEAVTELVDKQEGRPKQIGLPVAMGQPKVAIRGSCDEDDCSFTVTATDKLVTKVSGPGAIRDAVDELTRKFEERTGKGGTPLTFAIGANGVTRYSLEFKVVDVHQLIASHNPFTFEANQAYPQELQPRLRDRAATRVQVDKIAQNLEPASLLTDFRVLDRGAPIIGPDLVVESGNGRVMALQKAADDFPENFTAYVALLMDVIPTLGLSQADAQKLNHPVLVRVRLTDVDRKAFAEESNTSATIGASAIEQARSDAEKITPDMLGSLFVGDNQSIEDALRAAGNRSFVTQFLNTLPDTEQARLVDSDGRINQDGVRRMTMGVFVSAFQSGNVGLSLAEMAFESIDLDLRNVVNGIGRSLAPLANAESLTRIGARDSALSISEDLGAAITGFRKVKNTPGMTVAKYINQGQLFERELDDFQEIILQDIDTRSRSSKKIGTVIKNYALAVLDSPPPGQGMLIDLGPLKKEDLWRAAVAKADSDPTGISPGLFGNRLSDDAWWEWLLSGETLEELYDREMGTHDIPELKCVIPDKVLGKYITPARQELLTNICAAWNVGQQLIIDGRLSIGDENQIEAQSKELGFPVTARPTGEGIETAFSPVGFEHMNIDGEVITIVDDPAMVEQISEAFATVGV